MALLRYFEYTRMNGCLLHARKTPTVREVPVQMKRPLLYRSVILLCLVLRLTSAIALAQTPTVASVLNSADYSTNLCPGALAEIFGTNFGSGAASSVTVNVGGKQGYTIAVTSGQVAVQLPVDAPTVATTLTVTVNGVSSSPFSLTLDTYAPALYTLNLSGTGPGSIQTATGAPLT